MVKITADSTCDLTAEIREKYDITLTPLYITVDDSEEILRDGVDVTPDDIFRMVDKEKRTCKTAALNIFDYEKTFSEYVKQYDAIVHVNIGQNFSSCHQNAKIAAAEFDNVYVTDSRNLSTGSGYLVQDAAIMAKEGKSAEEIIGYIESSVPYINASFVIDRLDYLHKGGRCSGVALLGSKILNIKPCIEVADGAMRVGTKYIGKFEPSLSKYVRDRLSNPDALDLKRIYITHAACAPETVEAVRREIKKYADFGEIIETKAGCTVSNHCGPNTLGVLFKQLNPSIYS